MIVVDSSDLIAIIRNESAAQACIDALVAADRVLIEEAALRRPCPETIRSSRAKSRDVPHTLRRRVPTSLDTNGGGRSNLASRIPGACATEPRAYAAVEAYHRDDKDGQAAALNDIDSFAYAFAQEHDCPLLHVGNDFARTDVRSALAA